MADKATDHAQKSQQPQQQQLSRRSSSTTGSPFSVFDQFASEMDRLFEDFGLGRSWLGPQFSRGLASRRFAEDIWRPDVEVFQRNDEVVVRADLPGMTKDDIKVDVTDDAITISGERRSEERHDEGGVFRSERRYGSFARTIPLPEGAISDQAKATFNNGVLEVSVPAPPEQVRRGRRIEIGEGASQNAPQKK